jgi:FlaA1/EpsC-like NDP-sugar epimerase
LSLFVGQKFGIYNMVWRYISRVDAWTLVGALTTVSTGLLLSRLMMLARIEFPYILSLPIGVIVLDYLLVVSGT